MEQDEGKMRKKRVGRGRGDKGGQEEGEEEEPRSTL